MSPIELSDVVRGTDPASKVKLTATVHLGGVTIRFVRLVEGSRGPFVGMPGRKVGDNECIDIIELSDSLKSRVREALLGVLSQPPREEALDDLPF